MKLIQKILYGMAIITLIITSLAIMPVASAEEFYIEYFDGKRYPHQYEIKNGTITKIESLTNAQSLILM